MRKDMKNKKVVRHYITPGMGYQPIDNGIKPTNPPVEWRSGFVMQKEMDEKRKRRKCEVDGRGASFIQFAEEEQVYITINRFMEKDQAEAIVKKALWTHAIPAYCSLNTVKRIIALVEYSDGAVAKVEPESIRFINE